MKNLMFLFVTVIFFTTSAFTEVTKTIDEGSRTCYYDVVNSRGEVIGHVYVTDVPKSVSCGSKAAKAVALAIWQS